jgi:hypothetical protein
VRKLLIAALLLPVIGFADVHPAKYGVARTFNFSLYNADGTLDTDEVDSGTEVSLSCDEGAETTATNDFADEGTFYSIELTAAEMQCGRVAVVIAATDTNVFFVETYGHASSQHPDMDIAAVQAVLDKLELGIIEGAAVTGTLSTTQATTDLTGYADNQLIGRVIIWTSGAADGEASPITDYEETNGLITFQTMTTAPANGDTFKII